MKLVANTRNIVIILVGILHTHLHDLKLSDIGRKNVPVHTGKRMEFMLWTTNLTLRIKTGISLTYILAIYYFFLSRPGKAIGNTPVEPFYYFINKQDVHSSTMV